MRYIELLNMLRYKVNAELLTVRDKNKIQSEDMKKDLLWKTIWDMCFMCEEQ